MNENITHIKSRTGWFDIDFKDLWKYRDLVILFVKRNYNTRYKQTVLGPLWLILNPLITIILYAFVFGNLAGLSTDEAPQFAFYLCSNAIWSFFSTALTSTGTTFIDNSAIMGKVYFPRLVMPLAAMITGLLDLLIQIVMLLIVVIGYICMGVQINIGLQILLVPILIIQAGLLGLGCGIIIAACTTKYRDLAVLVSFGVQLWMYMSPVVYTTTIIPEKYRSLYMCNPIAPIIATWRYAILGVGELPIGFWGISWVTTLVVLFIGVILFSHIEKTFMDTI